MVFAHGQLRLYLLALLESGPKHGYELIMALADRFGGTYRPSPGTVYPRLARLEEEGLVRALRGRRRRATYTLTDAGRVELDERRGDLAALEVDVAESVRTLAAEVRQDVRGSMAGLRADLAAAAQEARAAARSGARGPVDDRAEAHRLRVEAEALVTRSRGEVKGSCAERRPRGGSGR